MTQKDESLKALLKDTECFTYEVTMVIQILAPNREIADAKLDQDGGYISQRDVRFLSSVKVHEGPDGKSKKGDSN